MKSLLVTAVRIHCWLGLGTHSLLLGLGHSLLLGLGHSLLLGLGHSLLLGLGHSLLAGLGLGMLLIKARAFIAGRPRARYVHSLLLGLGLGMHSLLLIGHSLLARAS